MPVLIYLLVAGAYQAALWVFLAAGLSDALDGFIARHFKQFSRLGAVLDPVADKLLIVSTFITLTWLEMLPLWLTVIIVARDAVIVTGAVCYHVFVGQVEMAPTVLGKLSTVAQLTLILLLLGHAAGHFDLVPAFPTLYAVVALIAVISGLQYVWVWGNKAAKRLA